MQVRVVLHYNKLVFTLHKNYRHKKSTDIREVGQTNRGDTFGKPP